MSNYGEYRDEELGLALRQLAVPEHRSGFEAALDRRLARRRRVERRRFRLGLAAAAAAAAAIAGLANGIPTTDRRPEVASAAEIQARVRASLADLRSLGGVLVEDGPKQGDERRWRFTLTAGGDFRLEGPDAAEVETYDASTGIARSAQRSESLGGGPLFYAERRGVAPGPPDQGPPTWLLPSDFGAFVRALLAADDPRVRPVVYDGRPAWRLDVDATPNAIVPGFSGDRFAIVVDRRTGMPVRVVETNHGAFIRSLSIEQLRVNEPPAPGVFRLAFPAGAEVMRSDDGFRRIALGRVRSAVGYAPLVPSWLPDGYEPAEVAVAETAGPTGKEAANPESHGVVSLSYRRGLDRFLVTTRLAGTGDWSDPLATGEGFVDHPERIAVRSGALRGANAELLIAPRTIPHVWARADGLVVTVSGDLSRAELLRVAGSLARR